MMRRPFIIPLSVGIAIWLAVLLPCHTTAANVTVTGTVKGATSKTLRILEYADRVSYLEREVAQTQIAPSGNFSVSFTIQETSPVTLSVGYYRGNLVLEPGSEYNLELNITDNRQKDGRLLSPGYINLIFTQREETGLNHMIERLEFSIDSFINADYESIYLRHDRSVMSHFIDTLKMQYGNYSHPFFNIYLEYTIGYLEYVGNLKSWESIRSRYFRNRRIDYGNPAFMDLFESLFDKYFIFHSPRFEFDPLVQMVNERNEAGEFFKRCMSDTLFASDAKMAELVMLLSIKDMFHQREFKKEKVAQLLNGIKSMVKYPLNKAIAINLLDHFNSLMPGGIAPDLSGIDLNHDPVQLEDFKGRKVLIVFWNSRCTTCPSEFSYMAPLVINRTDSLIILTVNVDESFDVFSHTVRTMPPGLQYIHIGMDYSTLDSYSVSSLPLYVLIDSSGRIVENPTITPFGDPALFLRKVVGIW